MTAAVCVPPALGLNPNWVEDLLRKEHKTVEDVWLSTFARDFSRYLSLGGAQTDHPANENNPDTVPNTDRLSKFDLYLVQQWALSDLRSLELNLAHFRNFIEQERLRRWQAAGATDTDTLPATTPFNSASAFLEFYFMKLVPVLKNDIVEHIRAFLQSEIGQAACAALSPAKVHQMTSLSPLEGVENAFDLVAVNPLETRSVRSLRAEDCGQIVSLTGTVTRCSDVKPELRMGSFECSACGTIRENVEQNFKLTEPAFCIKAGCGNRSKWIIRLGHSLFSDWQKLRLQQGEAENVPAGTVPRTIDIVARSAGVERCKPGDRILATGCLIAVPDVPSLMRPGELPSKMNQERNRALRSETGINDATVKGLSKLGVRELAYKQVFLATHIQIKSMSQSGPESLTVNYEDLVVNVTPESPAGRLLRQLMSLPPVEANSNALVSAGLMELLEHPLLRGFGLTVDLHRRFKKIAFSLDCVSRLISLVAPEIYGCDEVKKGLLLMLVGGVEKRTRKDHIKLRGDVNVCLVGDPGTAKSQLLKWIQAFSDRAIFTSGKSSTAAGLTASVHKDMDQGNETVVEAGALILADNGICCIDEFDKMDQKDMVAIHEAMEQQTISISKAGMQATMNARASVLAACNPVDGRYDVTKQLGENLRLSPTILSRFDLIFVLLDRADEAEDERVARHILGLATARPAADRPMRGAQLLSEEELRQYVRMAKAFRPRLTQEAKAVLVRKYVAYRQRESIAGQKRSMRLTVRQLESMLRLSEAVAKLAFSPIVTEDHANQAVQIFGNCLTRVKSAPIELMEDIEDDMAEGEPTETPILIQAELFEAIQGHIVTYIRRIDESNMLTPHNPVRTTMDNILEWYMTEFHSDLEDDEASRAFEERRLRLILLRMLSNGVVFEEEASLEDEESVVIRVHPNLSGDPTVRHRRARGHQTLPIDYYATTTTTSAGGEEAAPQENNTGTEALATGGGPMSLNLEEGDFLAMLYPS